ncbi:uracil-DNA glycosylase [Burkholderia gladioli]|uniref:uracil-DNA glycosylase n=1 Tax=Burkholderia gladioli TaxID=28095 RepID=UPI00156176AD|nr:uracil-DNA glycosylase [Burkholderia gladioli]MDN7714987.1 uracil-DNA glycosylase family protein [Burkholderia gladioli]NRF87626.1 uracil-DNA glycosylase [Burkholderia gladioli]
MSWLDSALDEMGLGPRWVRRGQGTAPAVAGEGEVQAGAAVAARPEALDDRPILAGSPTARADERLPQAAAREERAAPEFVSEPLRPAPGAKRPSDSVAPDMVARAPDAAPAARDEPPAPAMKAPADEAPPFDDPSWFDLAPAPDAPSPGLAPLPSAQPAAALASVADLGWDELEARVADCQRCRLCEKRTQTVFGVGDREADWMLVGEAPGENEDKQGEPFVGQAGKLLDSMLHALSLERSNNVYIANVIKCRPPGNRNPEPDEVARCEPYLQRQVALVKPKLIVALGRFAAQTLLKSDGSIASMRGRVHQYEGVPVIVSYHPAYLLRSLPDKSKAWADLCLARDTFGKATGGA